MATGSRDLPAPPPQRLEWLRGRPLSDVGNEPDYRFSLANERTFLAYIRTSLALLAGGVGAVALVPDFAGAAGRYALSLLLIVLSVGTAATSYRRWWLAERAMRLAQPLPAARLPQLLAVGLTMVSLAAIALVLVELTG